MKGWCGRGSVGDMTSCLPCSKAYFVWRHKQSVCGHAALPLWHASLQGGWVGKGVARGGAAAMLVAAVFNCLVHAPACGAGGLGLAADGGHVPEAQPGLLQRL